MSLPDWLVEVIPADTAAAWETIAPVVPVGAYLAGGTAIAVHLRHRLSRDLDFFLPAPVDLDALAEALGELGPLHISKFDPSPGAQTLNGTFSATKVQFLEASTLRMVEPTTRVEGLDVAGLGDLLAMKLKVITDRGELRDYFDLLVIDRDSPRHIEEGLALFGVKYPVRAPDESVAAIVRGLGYLDDVEDDPLVPIPRAEIEAYWATRLPEIVRHLSRTQ